MIPLTAMHSASDMNSVITANRKRWAYFSVSQCNVASFGAQVQKYKRHSHNKCIRSYHGWRFLHHSKQSQTPHGALKMVFVSSLNCEMEIIDKPEKSAHVKNFEFEFTTSHKSAWASEKRIEEFTTTLSCIPISFILSCNTRVPENSSTIHFSAYPKLYIPSY